MILHLVAGPASEPLTISEVITHLRLGSENLEPAPSAPTVALANLGAGNVDEGTHRYRLTFVTADGETDGGDISSPVQVLNKAANGRVSLTNIPTGGSAVIARRIYRTKALFFEEEFLLVATLTDNSETVYVDNLSDVNLGAGSPSTNTTHDPEIRRFIKAAREAAEQYLRKAMLEQTWKMILPEFPENGIIKIPKPPLMDVDSITYLDASGARVTLSTDVYAIDTDSMPGRVIRRYSQSWPTTYPEWNAVEVTFRCGYGEAPSDVPELYRHGMKLLISDFNENRELMNIGNIVNALPAVKRCFADRCYEVA